MSTNDPIDLTATLPTNGSEPKQTPAEVADGATPDALPPPPTQSVRGNSNFTSHVLVVLFYVIVGLALAWYNWGIETILKYSPYIGGVIALLLATAALPSTRRWFAHATAQRRIGAILIIAVGFILAFMVAIFFFEPEAQAAFLRLVFLIVVCSLPAVMYYLFIATKKYSLLNEFVINLGRLGLLEPSRVPPELVCAGLKAESELERQNRVQTYIQKFESVYGAVPTDLSGFFVKPTDTSQSINEKRASRSDGSGISNIFTFDTTLPVLVATLLIALGWLITLPPWDKKLSFFNRVPSTAATTATSIETQSQKIIAPEAKPSPTSEAAQPAAAAAPAQGTALAASTGEESQPTTATGAQGGTQPAPAPMSDSAAADLAAKEKWVAVFTPVFTPVRFAFIGAYFFALQLLFRRYVRRDLRASAYVNVSLRIILAMIGIWVVSAAVQIAPKDWLLNKDGTQATSDNLLLVLGFVVGVFPRVAWQVVQAALKRVASIAVPSLQTQLPVSDLDGLTVWHEARFEEEDIENIPNMATADIVDLMINTRLPPDRIIDWVDQAILYTHLGPEEEEDGKETRRRILREHGIRTASALVEAYNRSEQHKDREAFEKVLPSEGRNLIRSLVDAVGTNPNLKLVQTWRGLMPHVHGTDEGTPHETAAEPPSKSGSQNGTGSQAVADPQAQAQSQNGTQSTNGTQSANGGATDKTVQVPDTTGGLADLGGQTALAQEAAAQQSAAADRLASEGTSDEGLDVEASKKGQESGEAASQAEEVEVKEPDPNALEEASGKGTVETV